MEKAKGLACTGYRGRHFSRRENRPGNVGARHSRRGTGDGVERRRGTRSIPGRRFPSRRRRMRPYHCTVAAGAASVRRIGRTDGREAEPERNRDQQRSHAFPPIWAVGAHEWCHELIVPDQLSAPTLIQADRAAVPWIDKFVSEAGHRAGRATRLLVYRALQRFFSVGSAVRHCLFSPLQRHRTRRSFRKSMLVKSRPLNSHALRPSDLEHLSGLWGGCP